jgi:SSS family transporter
MLWVAVAAYFLISLGIGVWASRRIANETDYLVAGRSLGLVLVSGSLFATWFGAEMIMGSSAAIAEEGLAGGRADPFGYAICLVGMAFLIAYRMRDAGFLTLGDFFRARFGRLVELLAVLIMIPTSIIWAAAQLLALGEVITVVAPIDLETALVVSLVVVVVYTALGGLLGDAVNDVFHESIIIIGLIVLLIAVFAAVGGVGAAVSSITPEQLRFAKPEEGLLSRIDAWAVPIIGSLVAQEAISRFLGAKTPSIARNACFVAAGIYLTVGLMPVIIALVSANLDLGLTLDDTYLPLLAREMLPPVLFAVFAGALVSAILSTVDSTLLAVSALASRTFINPMMEWASDDQRLMTTRFTVAAAGFAAYVVATGSDSVYELVSTASSYGTAGIAVTVVVGLLTGFGGPRAALSALIAGLAATVALGAYYEEAQFILSLAISAATFFAVAFYEGRVPLHARS